VWPQAVKAWQKKLVGNDISLYNFSINFLTQGIYAAALAIFVYPGVTFLDKKLGPVSRSDELRMK